MAVADDGGAVAPLVAVVGHGHDDVVDDHHFVPGYKQGPDLKYSKFKMGMGMENIKWKLGLGPEIKIMTVILSK